MVEQLTAEGLKIGAAVEIGVDAADGYREYKTRVEDFEADRLVLAMPTWRARPVLVALGEPAQVMIPSERGGKLFLGCEVIARQAEPLPMLTVQVLAVGQEQSRSYVRVYYSTRPLECSVWEMSAGASEAYWRHFPAAIQDLSGGGIGLLCHEPIAEGARVRLRFPLPCGGGYCRVSGEVKLVRTSGRDDRPDNLPLTAGLEVQEIARADRERLIKAVLRFQSEERRIEVTRLQASAAGE